MNGRTLAEEIDILKVMIICYLVIKAITSYEISKNYYVIIT